MKKQFLIIVFLLTTLAGFAQTVQTQGTPNRATRYLGGLQADSTFVVPVRNHDSIYPNLPYKGRVQVNSETNVLEYHNGEQWVPTGSESNDASFEKIEKQINSHTAQVKFPVAATDDSYWVFPQANSSPESPRYVPMEINGAIANSNGSVAVSMQSVINNTIGKLVSYNNLSFYVPDYAMDTYPDILTYNTSPDEANFTIVGGVRNDGRAYGPPAEDESDYVTKNQLESSASPITKIDEGNGPGYALSDRSPENYGSVGLGAVDLSTSTTEGIRGAVGDYSFAAGASTSAHGTSSVAIGTNTIANAYGSLSIGYNNQPGISAPENTSLTGSPLLIIGNGDDSSNRSNAYVLYNDGSSVQSGIATYSEDFSENYTERSLVDKGYVDSLALEENTMLRKIISENVGIVKLPNNITTNFIWEFPQSDGTEESPTYVIRSISGQQANSVGEVEIGLQSTINYTNSSPSEPVSVNDRLHFYTTPSESLYNLITFYNYNPTEGLFIPISGIKFDGRSYGPTAFDNEDYVPLSQIESLIDDANSMAMQLSNENPAMVFDLGSGTKTSIEALSPNPNVDSTLQFPSPHANGTYRLTTSINGYNADSTGRINIDAHGIFNSGSVVIVQDLIDLRSDEGLAFTHATSGNKLELGEDGIQYNDEVLVDKPTLINYVASATNTAFTAPKSASDLNSAYPGVNEGFIVKCPNAGGIYLKTAVAGQWQFIAATTINP